MFHRGANVSVKAIRSGSVLLIHRYTLYSNILLCDDGNHHGFCETLDERSKHNTINAHNLQAGSLRVTNPKERLQF